MLLRSLTSLGEPSSGKKIAIRKSIIWLNGPGFADPRRKGVWGLEILRPLILPFCASGGGAWKPSRECGCIVLAKYMRNASVASVTVKINDSPCWKDLMKVKSLYLAGRKGVVGSGDIIRFWEDSWWGEAPLYQTYPKLFLFCNSKDTSIAVFKHDIHDVSFSRWLHGPLACYCGSEPCTH